MDGSMHGQERRRGEELRDGDSFYCPHCESTSIARLKREYEGFSVKRSHLCCAFCGREIDPRSGGACDSSQDALDALFSSPEEGPDAGAGGSSPSAPAPSSASGSSSPSALDELFGGCGSGSPACALDSILPCPPLVDAGSQGKEREPYHFCKNCVHHFENPFRVHCVLHDKDVEPMADCPDFAAINRRK